MERIYFAGRRRHWGRMIGTPIGAFESTTKSQQSDAHTHHLFSDLCGGRGRRRGSTYGQHSQERLLANSSWNFQDHGCVAPLFQNKLTLHKISAGKIVLQLLKLFLQLALFLDKIGVEFRERGDRIKMLV